MRVSNAADSTVCKLENGNGSLIERHSPVTSAMINKLCREILQLVLEIFLFYNHKSIQVLKIRYFIPFFSTMQEKNNQKKT